MNEGDILEKINSGTTDKRYNISPIFIIFTSEFVHHEKQRKFAETVQISDKVVCALKGGT